MSQMYAQQPAITSIFERSFAHDQIKANPYKAGELNSGRMYPTPAPHQRGDGRGWIVPNSEPSISEHKRGPYDILPTDRSQDDILRRREVSPRLKTGEQLPPLSSLFSSSGPPTASRPSYSNQSPTFDPVSPKSLVRKPGPNHQDQLHWDPSYPSRPHSQPLNQYAYTRPSILQAPSELPLPPPRGAVEHRKPDSPGYFDARSEFREAHRDRTSTSSIGWSPRSEPPYRDYFPPMSKDGRSPYGHPRDQKVSSPRIHLHEPDARHRYPETRPNPLRNQYPLTAANTVASDLASPKDTLGPKIWTGTHFLPRFVRQAEVPGEGICYFYDDGTHCKTVIDGEPVNAHWGVTKAGKPRKRLAIACITCREKKIKCDPDYPRCVQCDKFGRVCKFKNAPRGGQGSPESPPADSDDILTRSVSQLSELEVSRYERRDLLFSAFHQGKLSPGSEGEESAPKRRRSGYEAYLPVNPERPEGHFSQNRFPLPQQLSPTIKHGSLDWCKRQATENPFDAGEEIHLELLDAFFANIANTTYCFLPELHFRRWVTDRSVRKMPQDIMLIYTVLALATTFSIRDDAKLRGEEYAAIGRRAGEGREFSLQLVQSRLLLSLYYVSVNKSHESLDFCGAAVRAATWLGFNLEMDESEKASKTTIFNLNPAGYAECRRRTFWSCYIMDHYTGFCNGHLNAINPKDVFLRYPTETKNFEAQSDIVAPPFDYSGAPMPGGLENAGIMAYLINVTSIWGDVRDHIYRGSRTSSSSSEPSPSFHATTTARLEAWRTCLPHSLENTTQNLDNALAHGTLGSFVAMHAIYHVTHAKLNRYTCPAAVASFTLQGHVRAAHQHAAAVLRLAETLGARAARQPGSAAARRRFASPYFGFVIVAAVDIVSAKGRLADIPALRARVDGARRVVDELAGFWHSARLQREQIAARLDALAALPLGAGPGEATVDAERGAFEMRCGMDGVARSGNDCVYAVGLEAWAKATEI